MATLKDVAKETGLSIGTISRVLNNRGYISDETRDKVSQAMKKLNYQPNELARSLSKQTSTIIGVIIPSLRHPYFANLTSAIEETAIRMGYQTLVFQSNGKRDQEASLLEQCMKNRVAGVILCSGLFSTTKLDDMGIPVVTVERMQENASSSIECDNKEGGRLAATHLIDRGCRNLLEISTVQGNIMPADDRESGFVEICEERKVEHHEIPFSEAVYESMDYIHFLSGVIDTFPRADGIFCTSDIAASQVLQVCAKKGIQVPEQMKVVGFDDIPLASMTTPPLTTIRQPVKEMARMAVTALLGAVLDGTAGSTITMRVSLVVRETT